MQGRPYVGFPALKTQLQGKRKNWESSVGVSEGAEI